MQQIRKENEARRRQDTEREQGGKEEEEEYSSEGTRMVARMYLRWITGGKKGGGGEGSRGEEGEEEERGEGVGLGELGEGAESLLTVALNLLPHISQSSQEDPVKEVRDLSETCKHMSSNQTSIFPKTKNTCPHKGKHLYSYQQTLVLIPVNMCPHNSNYFSPTPVSTRPHTSKTKLFLLTNVSPQNWKHLFL